jgi:uncharacterized protein (TIGR02145 family)
MKTTILFFAVLVFLTIQNYAQTVTDIDGNIYSTVTIGTQVWMKENLKVTHYRDGDTIPNITDSTSWTNLNSGAYCSYNNDTSFISTYGLLYNWYAVIDSNNIAPQGWHIPTLIEWQTLVMELGGISIAGGKMKEADTLHWLSPNAGATNESEFTALPTGLRHYFSGQFMDISQLTMFWSSTACDTIRAYNCYLNNSNIEATLPVAWFEMGFSVRCIKDTTSNQINENDIEKYFKLYPNPSTDRIVIDIANSQNLNLYVYTIVGELVLQKKLNNNKNEIDISTLSTGLYVVKVLGTKWTKQIKMIKD